MFRVELGASNGFRFSIVTVATALAVLLATSPADARHRHRHGGKAKVVRLSYTPPYAAIVVDANSGKVLHETNADGVRHPASLTKIMTLYLLFEQLEAGKIKLDSEMEVSAHAASMAPTKLGVKPGQTLRVEDAIRALVTKSANDAAVVVAEALAGDEDRFGQLMTRKARALGMSRTVYRNASGLPNDEQVTTARDQALLGRAIQERFPRYYKYFSTPSFTFRGQAMRNHNHLLGRVPGVDGIKTGYIAASGFNLVTSVRRGNRHLVAVVMGGRSAGARDARMRELIDANIVAASAQHTAPPIAELAAAAPRVAAAVVAAPLAAVAAAIAPAAAAAESPAVTRADPVATATIPSVGSNDDIRPIPVKTVRVKASTLKPATIGAAPTMSVPTSTKGARASAAPAAITVAAAADPAVARQPAIEPEEDPTSLSPPAMAAAASPSEPVAARPATSEVPRTPPAHTAHSGWVIQVGAFDAMEEAKGRLASAQSKARKFLGNADPFTEPVMKGEKTLYRARFAGLEKEQAEAACRYLKRNDMPCMAIKN